MFLTLIYAPILIVSLIFFPIKNVSFFLIGFAFIWGVFNFIKKKSILYPSFLLILGFLTYLFDDFFFIKSFPFILSLSFFIIFLMSNFTKKFIMVPFIEKIKKRKLNSYEFKYIQKSNIFWTFITFVNVTIQFIVLNSQNQTYWLTYTSIGWYILFGIAMILQILHRRFFAKIPN